MNPDKLSLSIPDRPFLLATPGDLQPAVTLGLGLPARVSGMPAFYYWKDAIVVGSYVHPAGKFSLNITRDKLDGYAENFKRMKSNGVAVPILMDHAQSAAATLGWILDVTRRGDRLLELHQFLGQDARDIGLRNMVSLGIDPDFVDGKGNRYGEAIVHSAVTPMPVVPGQGGFEPVETAEQTLMLSLSDDVESNAPHLARREDTPGSPPSEQTVIRSNDNPRCDHGGLNGRISELAMSALADAAAAKRDLAIARGALDPAAAEELFALLVRSADGSVNTLSLQSANSISTSPLALAVFDVLSRNQPTSMGEQTQLQVLSRNIPGLDFDRLELQQRMIALASGK